MWHFPFVIAYVHYTDNVRDNGAQRVWEVGKTKSASIRQSARVGCSREKCEANRNENGKHKGQKFFFFFHLFRQKIDKSLTNTHDFVWLWVNICMKFFESVQVLSMWMGNIWCRTVNIARIDIEDLSLPAYKVKVYSSFCERFEIVASKEIGKVDFCKYSVHFTINTERQYIHFQRAPNAHILRHLNKKVRVRNIDKSTLIRPDKKNRT